MNDSDKILSTASDANMKGAIEKAVLKAWSS
jgi:hypothetical protein